MYKKTKAILSAILASVLIESTVFTSVAAPMVSYGADINIESSIGSSEELDDYEDDTNDANVTEEESNEEEIIEETESEEEESLEEDNGETESIEETESEEESLEEDNGETESGDESLGGDTEETGNTEDTESEENGSIDNNKDETEGVEESTENNKENLNETNSNEEEEIEDSLGDTEETDEDVEESESTDEKDLLDEIELENDLIVEDKPIRITPRKAVDENNLSEALQEVRLYTYENEEVNSDELLINDSYYYIELSFEEDDENQFNGIDTYKLPDGFKAYGKDVSGSFECEDYGTDEVFKGTYTINSKGLITFKFPKVYDGGYFPEYFDNTILEAKIKVKIDISEGSIEFENGQTWEIYKDRLDFDIDKVNPHIKELDNNQLELTYNIKPWIIDGSTSELVISDTLGDIDYNIIESAEYDLDSIKVKYYNDTIGQEEDFIKDTDYTLELGDNSFEIGFIGKEFKTGDSLYIEYSVLVDMVDNYYDTNIENTAEIKANDKIKKASTKSRLFKEDMNDTNNGGIDKQILNIREVSSADGKVTKFIRYGVDIDTSKVTNKDGKNFDAISNPILKDTIVKDNTTGWNKAEFELADDGFELYINDMYYYAYNILEKEADGFRLNLNNYVDYLEGNSNVHIEYDVKCVLERDYDNDSTLTNFEYNLSNICTLSGVEFTSNGFEEIVTSGETDVIIDSYKRYEAEPFGVDVNGELDKDKIKWALEINETPLKGMVVTSKISKNQDFIKESGIDLEITHNENGIFFNKELTQDKLHIEPDEIEYVDNEITFSIPVLFSEKPMGDDCDRDFNAHIVATYCTNVIDNTNEEGMNIATNDVYVKKCEVNCVAKGEGIVELPSTKVNLSKYSDAVTTIYKDEYVGYTIKLQAHELGVIPEKGLRLIDELPNELTVIEDSIYISDDNITVRIEDNKLIFENITLEDISDDIVIKYNTIVNEKLDSYNISLINRVNLYDKDNNKLGEAIAEINASRDIESSAIAGGSGYVVTDFDGKVEVEGNYIIKGEDFKFNIEADANNPKNDPINGGTILNNSEGLIDLFKNELKYVGPGEYTYYISQVVDDNIEGMNYDTSVYKVVVKIDYIDKKLQADVIISKDNEVLDEILFKNKLEEKPSEPDTKPSEPENKPSEPENKPSEPDTKPSEPENKPSEPEKPDEPENKPSEPEKPDEPENKPSEPETEPSEPDNKPDESETKPSEPETKPDTLPSGNGSSGGDNSNSSEPTNNTPITTINDNDTPLANMESNRINELAYRSRKSADESLNYIIDDMMIPLSDTPDIQTEDSLDKLPKTDDVTNKMLYEVIMFISILGLAVAFKRDKR